eukprot:7315619-Alexandrium_andersonii.AAC.1
MARARQLRGPVPPCAVHCRSPRRSSPTCTWGPCPPGTCGPTHAPGEGGCEIGGRTAGHAGAGPPGSRGRPDGE